MPTLEELKHALERLEAQEETDADRKILVQAFNEGRITVARGDRSVAVGGDVRDSVIVTGDDNAVSVIKPATVEVLRLWLEEQYPKRLYQLPNDLPDFTGRDREVQVIGELCSGQSESAVLGVAIGGMGGLGKSALAAHLAHLIKDRYPDAQLWVDMRGTSETPLSPNEAMRQVIFAFNPTASMPKEADEIAQLYRSVFSGKQALIVLDNASDVSQIRPLLPPSSCMLIVTSRRALSLPALRALNLDVMSETESERLVQAMVGARRVPLNDIKEICGLCGHLPLALRAAGTFLDVNPDWTAAQYISSLTRERTRLTKLKVEDLDVGATLGLSAAQLVKTNEELVAKWQMLTVFGGSFDCEAAAAVWEAEQDEAKGGLSELRRRSLVFYDAGSNRYFLHDLMRLVARDFSTYVNDKLGLDTSSLDEAAVRHARHYLTILEKANSLYNEGGETLPDGLALLNLEWPNIDYARAWVSSHQDESKDAASLCSSIPARGGEILLIWQYAGDQLRWLESALSAARTIGDREAVGKHLARLGWAHFSLGEAEKAIGYYEQALTICRETRDRLWEGLLANYFGAAYYLLQEHPKALKYFGRAVRIGKQERDKRLQGAALSNIGNVYLDMDDALMATKYFEQALAIARDGRDRDTEALTLEGLGSVQLKIGEAEKAIEYIEQSLAIFRERGDWSKETRALWTLGDAYYRLGKMPKAIEYLEQARSSAAERGDRPMEAFALASMATLQDAVGDYENALSNSARQRAILHVTGDPDNPGLTHVMSNARKKLGERRYKRVIREVEKELGVEIADG